MRTRLRIIRHNLNLTQASFAAQLGVSVTAVSDWEKGLRAIPASRVLAICNEFNVNRSWLETGEGEMFTRQSRDDVMRECFVKTFESLELRHRAVVLDLMVKYCGLPREAADQYLKEREEEERKKQEENKQK